MRFLKLYGGSVLILLAAVVLFIVFKCVELDKGTYNTVLVCCLVAIVLGVALCIIGGRIADKIGGK